MKKPDKSFDDIIAAVTKHIAERHWDNHSARGLAISIAIESNELLEHYQWSDEPVGNVDEIAEELADIMVYAIQFANKYDIDMTEAIQKKLDKAAKKYPVEKFQTTNPAEQKAAWLEAKTNHKKDTVL